MIRRWRAWGGPSLGAALPGWLLARAAVVLGFVVAVVAADELRPGDRPLQLDQGLFAWDAAFYRDIADVGYGGVAEEGLRFFPLLPLLARVVSVPLLGNVGLATVLLVNAAALLAAVLLHRLVLDEFGDGPAATRAAWLLALLPPATVLVLGYAEALLLAATIGAFLALRRRQWWWAAALGVAAGLCRPTGAALVVPAAIEAWRGLGGAAVVAGATGRWRRLVPRAAAVVAPIVGCGLYLAWVEMEYGDWELPLRLQNSADLRGGWANPVSTVLDAIRHAGDEGWGEALHLPWIALFGFLLVVCWRRLPASYTAYAAVLLAFALSGHTLGSFERYGLAAFPLVIALALLLRTPREEVLVIAACTAGLASFATLELLGAFVP